MSGRSRPLSQRRGGAAAGGAGDDSGESAEAGSSAGRGAGPLSPAPQGRAGAGAASTPRRHRGEPSEKENVENRASSSRPATPMSVDPASGAARTPLSTGLRKSRRQEERRERIRTNYGGEEMEDNAFSPPRSSARKRSAPTASHSELGLTLGGDGRTSGDAQGDQMQLMDMSREPRSIAAALEREASEGSGADGPLTGPIDMDEEFDAMIRAAPSFADRPPTPSPPRPGLRAARCPLAAARAGEAPPPPPRRPQAETLRRPPPEPEPVPADSRPDRASAAARATPSRAKQSPRRPRSAPQSRKNPPAQASGATTEPRPRHPPQQQQQHQQPQPSPGYSSYPPPGGHYGYAGPAPGAPYMGSPYGPPPPGYYVAPPPGAYYGGYGPPPPPSPYHGYAPQPPQGPPPPGWPGGPPPPPESPYGAPPQSPYGAPQQPPPPSHQQHMRGPPPPSRDEEPSRGREPPQSRMRAEEDTLARMQQQPAPPPSVERRRRLTPRTDPLEDPARDEGQPPHSGGLKGTPFKKRKMTITPKTAATALTTASTPPESDDVVDATTTIMTASSPYPSPNRASARREGGGAGQRSPVPRLGASAARTPQRSPLVGFRSSPPPSVGMGLGLPRTPGGGMLPLSRAPTFTMDTPGGNGENLVDPARLDDFFPIESGATFDIDVSAESSEGGNGGGNGGRMVHASRFEDDQDELSREEERAERALREEEAEARRLGFDQNALDDSTSPRVALDDSGELRRVAAESATPPPGAVGGTGLFGDDDYGDAVPGTAERLRRFRQMAGAEASPFTNFIGELESPLPSHLQGSPTSTYGRNSRRPSTGGGGLDYYDQQPLRGSHPSEMEMDARGGGRRLPEPIPSLSRREGGGSAQRGLPHTALEASPLSVPPSSGGRHHHHHQQPLYHDDRPSPRSGRPFRLELGSVGMKRTEARRGLGDINAAVRGDQGHGHHYNRPPSPPRSYGPPPGYYGAPHPMEGPPHPGYGGEMRTPIKTGTPSAAAGSGSSQTPSRMVTSVGPPPSALARAHGAPPPGPPGMAPPSVTKSFAPPPGVYPGATPLKTPASIAAASAARGRKENAAPTPNRAHAPNAPAPTPQILKAVRRNPCNCKKSKCLKLYCECFAAELYCSGCNCRDCSNTTADEEVRAKAIRDTKAKNPNAFKNRITAMSAKAAATMGGATGVGGAPGSQMAHSMGCRCKKSACLKKYCECFEAGVMCGSKCKCVECLNYVGSQALIDRRRKIKDHRGAELAMRNADEAWKGGGSKVAAQPGSQTQTQTQQVHKPPASTGRGTPLSGMAGRGTPVGGMPPHAHMGPYGSPMHSHHPGPPPPHMMMHAPSPQHGMPPHYMGGPPPPMMIGHHGGAPPPPHMVPGPGYSPMGMAQGHQHQRHRAPTPSSGRSTPAGGQQGGRSTPAGGQQGGRRSKSAPRPRGASSKQSIKSESSSRARSRGSAGSARGGSGIPTTPMTTKGSSLTPRTPRAPPAAVRLPFDLTEARKRRRARLGGKAEPLRNVFGKGLPKQTETTGLGIFSFLGNDDLYNASLVCRGWNTLGMHEELWKY